MSVEIRPLTADEVPQLYRNLNIGFSNAPPQPGAEPPNIFDPAWSLCAFEDGELATTYAAWPFEIYLNGKVTPAAGVTMVTTQPWHRRRGYLRQIMATDFRRMHEEGGPPIAILYASMAAIYQRFGYGIVSQHTTYQIEPRFIEFAEQRPVTGRYRRFTVADRSRVEPVYERFAGSRTGYIKRTPFVWENQTFGHWQGGDSLIGVSYEEEGETLGYLIYRAAGREREPRDLSGGGVRAEAFDFTWLTPAAYRALWSYLRQIDLAQDVIVRQVPPDDPAPDLFLEPRRLHATASDGLLARISDVERALVARNYSAAGRLTFALQDEMAPWNAGRWELETDGEATTVRRSERAPELTMPVATLAPLLFGHFSASQGARMGRLDANDPAALARWDALMRTEYPPACANGF